MFSLFYRKIKDLKDYFKPLTPAEQLLNILIPDERMDKKSFYIREMSTDPSQMPFETLKHVVYGANGVVLFENKLFYIDQDRQKTWRIEEKEALKEAVMALKSSITPEVVAANEMQLQIISSLTGLNYWGNVTNDYLAMDFYEKNKHLHFNFLTQKSLPNGILIGLYQYLMSDPQLNELFEKILKNPLTIEYLLNNMANHWRFFLAFPTYNKTDLLCEFIKTNTPIPDRANCNDFFIAGEPEDKLMIYFQSFPIQEIWRLFIDAEKQLTEIGWLDFECREPGYLKAMLNAWTFLINGINEPLTLTLIQQLHAACSGSVENLNDDHAGSGRFREDATGFGLIYNSNVSARGLIEILDNIKDKPYEIKELRLEVPKLSSEEIEKIATIAIDQYGTNITLASEPIEKLRSIIEFIVNLERMHPFADANTRTFSMLLLNRELIRQGFSPTILYDPNRMAGYSVDELMNEVTQGMERFQQVSLSNTQELGLSTTEINKIASQEEYSSCKESHQALSSFNIQLPHASLHVGI